MPHPTGLRPTLRQMMILILWIALLIVGTRSLIAWGVFGLSPEFDCILVPIVAGTYPLPSLAILLRFLDRPGPVRGWYYAVGMAAASVVAGALFLLQDPASFALTGHVSLTFPTAPILAPVCLLSAWYQVRTSWPRRCTRCGRRAIVAVARQIRPGSRRWINTGKDGWCASCGAEYKREGTGVWSPKAADHA